MPVAPKPFMAKCPKCGKMKLVAPKSDAGSPLDFLARCESCGEFMERVDLSNEVASGLSAIKETLGKIFGGGKK